MPPSFGEPAPAFNAPGTTNPRYVFHSAAGRPILLGVLTALGDQGVEAGRALIRRLRGRFDDLAASLFLVIADTEAHRQAAQDVLPGVRWLFDDGSIAAAYAAADRPLWFLIDPAMRVVGWTGDEGVERLVDALPHLAVPPSSLAPVLDLPRVFEPDFCDRLIALYRKTGGRPSGFMRDIDGVTTLMMDDNHKRRSDVLVDDAGLRKQIQARLARRLAPAIQKAFQYEATRIERYLVARYDAETGGWFRPHRDNTTRGTAHRRFAVSINLNADFDGGDLRFPEFGARTYRPRPGGAVVFSCSLLHEATPVTRGERFAFLPFLYDEAGARLRAENAAFVAPDIEPSSV